MCLTQQWLHTHVHADPPLTSHGKVTKVNETSLELMIRSLDEYVGYANKYHGVEPSMDLVMQPNMFSKFMAFKVARGNMASTMLRAAQQVSLVVPFVMSGHCPQASTWSQGHAAQVGQWYKTLKAGYREKAAATPAKRSAVPLLEQWDAAEAVWGDFIDAFEVRPSSYHCAWDIAPLPFNTLALTPSTHVGCRTTTHCGPLTWPCNARGQASRCFCLAGSNPLSGLVHLG